MKKRTKVVLAVLAIGSLVSVSPVLWLGVCVWRSPDFEEWVRAHPVEDAAAFLAVSDLGELEVAASGLPAVLPVGFEPQEGARAGTWSPSVAVLHGNDVLLELELEARLFTEELPGADLPDAEAPPRTERLVGLAVRAVHQELHPDLHGVALLGVGGLDRDFGGGSLWLDVFLFSGPGDVDVRLVEFDGPRSNRSLPVGLPTMGEPVGFLRSFVPSAPPDEGLAVQASLGASLTWRRTLGGSSGASHPFPRLTTNARAYSFAVHVESAVAPPWSPEGGSSMSTSASRHFEWMGEVW